MFVWVFVWVSTSLWYKSYVGYTVSIGCFRDYELASNLLNVLAIFDKLTKQVGPGTQSTDWLEFPFARLEEFPRFSLVI